MSRNPSIPQTVARGFEIVAQLMQLIPIFLGTLLVLGMGFLLMTAYQLFYDNLTMAIHNPKEIDPSFLQHIRSSNKAIIRQIDADKKDSVEKLFSWVEYLWSYFVLLLMTSFLLLLLSGFTQGAAMMISHFSLDSKMLRQTMENSLGKDYEILIKYTPKPQPKYVSFRLSGL